ncbi:uncharacterized protein BT62DRAFT_1014424 [Guyanagaster necrorhizus]|uniref:Uncharacterized protein n=1 Tax=Guyanagaster necrorhizus TaxID=856835 RepID=A0A9P7VEH1_9AGAR|nr:uncharacterized protein BT62DRAFT_1014424 [Guyanagaster necrorhizus MCA 3950]KAG7439077.1 hypothetical protein BT62DRAFT_1014424 [Guyanagaster necrorhizus MCA 3950]
MSVVDTNKNIENAKDGRSITARILGNKFPNTKTTTPPPRKMNAKSTRQRTPPVPHLDGDGPSGLEGRLQPRRCLRRGCLLRDHGNRDGVEGVERRKTVLAEHGCGSEVAWLKSTILSNLPGNAARAAKDEPQIWWMEWLMGIGLPSEGLMEDLLRSSSSKAVIRFTKSRNRANADTDYICADVILHPNHIPESSSEDATTNKCFVLSCLRQATFTYTMFFSSALAVGAHYARHPSPTRCFPISQLALGRIFGSTLPLPEKPSSHLLRENSNPGLVCLNFESWNKGCLFLSIGDRSSIFASSSHDSWYFLTIARLPLRFVCFRLINRGAT